MTKSQARTQLKKIFADTRYVIDNLDESAAPIEIEAMHLHVSVWMVRNGKREPFTLTLPMDESWAEFLKTRN